MGPPRGVDLSICSVTGIHLCSFGWGWRTWYSMTCHFNVLKIDNWCSKGHGMYYPVCEMEHIKYPLQLTERSMKQQQVSSLITEWSLTVCLMPGNNKWNVLRALVNKTFSFVFLPSFPPENEAFSWRHFKHCFKTFKTYITKHTWLVCTTTLLDIIEILSEIQWKKKKAHEIDYQETCVLSISGQTLYLILPIWNFSIQEILPLKWRPSNVSPTLTHLSRLWYS